MTPYSTPRIRWISVASTVLLVILIGLLLMGCHTVTPDPVQAQTISYDGGVQNAGIISLDNTGAVITAEKRDYYNSLIAIYGDAKWTKNGLPIFTPPLVKDQGVVPANGYFHITSAALANLTVMHQWFKMGRTPQ